MVVLSGKEVKKRCNIVYGCVLRNSVIKGLKESFFFTSPVFSSRRQTNHHHLDLPM